MTTHAVSSIVRVPDDVRVRFRADLLEAATHRQRQLDLLLTDGPEAGADVDPAVTAQRATLRQLLQQIGAAQARLDKDTFGHCEHCHAAIPLPRLEVRPWTTACIACAA